MQKEIVLVDDDATIMEMLYLILKGIYTVFPFSKGNDALLYVIENGADLVITDLLLPDINGEELIKNIKEVNDLDIPIILITGAANTSSLAIKGAAMILEKPFTIPELLKSVQDVLSY